MKGFKGNSDVRFVTSKQLGPAFGPSTIVGSRMAIASYNAISLGLQAGYVYQLNNKLGLNAEVGMRWLRAASSDYFFEARDKFVPVSLGVRYTLGAGLGKKG
ncbi:MAG: hypothetical protein EOP56_12220 [Sphingobacteriales bacterium]|nr:MAG: hypothetical protein EOP56_12220 [Sphingobacteriales bacterium]